MTPEEKINELEKRIEILELKVRILNLEKDIDAPNPYIFPKDDYPKPYRYPDHYPVQPATTPVNPYPWNPVIYCMNTGSPNVPHIVDPL